MGKKGQELSKRIFQKPESIPENETHTILWDFEIQRISHSRLEYQIRF